MKNVVFLLYEGDEWLSNDSLRLRGVFSDTKELEKGAQQLIEHLAGVNFDSRDYNYPITLEDFVSEELTDFMENFQTYTGSVKLIAKTEELNELSI